MKFYFFLVRTEQLKVVWKAVFYLQALRPPVRLKLVRKKKSYKTTEAVRGYSAAADINIQREHSLFAFQTQRHSGISQRYTIDKEVS